MKLVACLTVVSFVSHSFAGTISFGQREQRVEGTVEARTRSSSGAIQGGQDGYLLSTSSNSPDPVTGVASVFYSDPTIASLAYAAADSYVLRSVLATASSATIEGTLATLAEAQNSNGTSPLSSFQSTSEAVAVFSADFTITRPYQYSLGVTDIALTGSQTSISLTSSTAVLSGSAGMLAPGTYSLVAMSFSKVLSPADGVLRSTSAISDFSLELNEVSLVPLPPAAFAGAAMLAGVWAKRRWF